MCDQKDLTKKEVMNVLCSVVNQSTQEVARARKKCGGKQET